MLYRVTVIKTYLDDNDPANTVIEEYNKLEIGFPCSNRWSWSMTRKQFAAFSEMIRNNQKHSVDIVAFYNTIYEIIGE